MEHGRRILEAIPTAAADVEPSAREGAGLHVDVERPREERRARHVRGGGVEESALDASEVPDGQHGGPRTVA